MPSNISSALIKRGHAYSLTHPKKENQYIFVIEIDNYIWVVPFVMEGDIIFLKTAFPSRKFNKINKREVKKR